MSRKYDILCKSVLGSLYLRFCIEEFVSFLFIYFIIFWIFYFFSLSHFRDKVCVGHSEERGKDCGRGSGGEGSREQYIFTWFCKEAGGVGSDRPNLILNRIWGNDILYTSPGMKVIFFVRRCLFKWDRWYELNCVENVFVLSHHT